MTHRDGWEGPPPRELIIVMLSAIGDAVHVLPVANALRRAWPDTRITWAIQPGPLELMRGHRAIDSFLVFHRRRGLAGLKAFHDFRREVRPHRFDLLLGLQVYLKAGVLTALAHAQVKVGFDRARARDAQWLFTTHRIPAHPPQHVQDQYFEFVRWLGVDPEPVAWGLTLTEQEQEEQARFFSELGGPALAVVVGTSTPERDWYPAGYTQVLEEAHRVHGLRPVLVGGTSERESRMATAILDRSATPVVDARGGGLRRLLWLVQGSALTLSPDTGPLHISRAVETPVVGLFGRTNPRRTGPYRIYQDLVVDGYARWPGEEYPPVHSYRDGMRRITPEMVLEKLALAAERYLP